MGTRHQGRELALKALYQIDLKPGASNEDLLLLFEQAKVADDVRRFATNLVEGVRGEQVALEVGPLGQAGTQGSC